MTRRERKEQRERAARSRERQRQRVRATAGERVWRLLPLAIDGRIALQIHDVAARLRSYRKRGVRLDMKIGSAARTATDAVRMWRRVQQWRGPR